MTALEDYLSLLAIDTMNFLDKTLICMVDSTRDDLIPLSNWKAKVAIDTTPAKNKLFTKQAQNSYACNTPGRLKKLRDICRSSETSNSEFRYRRRKKLSLLNCFENTYCTFHIVNELRDTQANVGRMKNSDVFSTGHKLQRDVHVTIAQYVQQLCTNLSLLNTQETFKIPPCKRKSEICCFWYSRLIVKDSPKNLISPVHHRPLFITDKSCTSIQNYGGACGKRTASSLDCTFWKSHISP